MNQNSRAYYMNLAREAARRYGVPEDLFLSLIQQESNFDPSVVSSAGAIGLAQLMPDTAKELGVNPHNVEENLAGGARYLNQMLGRFPDVSLALAAYNAGPTRVARLGRIPNIEETQNYVKSVLGRLPDGRPANMPLSPNMTPRPVPKKDKPMNLMSYMQNPQALKDKLLERNPATGLNFLTAVGVGLDALVHPNARMGQQIRDTAAQTMAYKKEQDTKNATVTELERISKTGGAAGNLATQLLAAVKSGAMSPADAYKTLTAQLYDTSGDKVRSSLKFKNGAYYVITDKGRKVYNPEGILVPEGPEAAAVLREAELSGIAMEGLSTGTSEAAKFQQKSANDAFEKADALTAQIATIDRAIAEIDGGARRNVLLNMLPDITAKAGGLNSALRQMGLDVVSSVTFGALSQSELDIAMATAYPPNANEQELRIFLVKRKEALEKLRAYTEEAASFLLNPNNTKADWMEIVRARRDQQASEGMQNPYMGMSVEALNEAYRNYANMSELEKTQFRDALKAAQANQ